MAEQDAEVDYALVAFVDDGAWQVQDIASPAFDIRRHPQPRPAPGLRSRRRRRDGRGRRGLLRAGPRDGSTTRVLLSDITAAEEWELAQSVVDFLGLPPPEDDDEAAPAGDLDLLGDLGLHAIDMGALLDDDDLYPDECSPTSPAASASASSSTTPSG